MRILAACLALLTLACSAETSEDTPPDVVSSFGDGQQFVQARVVGVIDGTTIDVDVDGQIRRIAYLGVTIPEDSPTRQQALEFNRFMVGGRTVQLEKDAVEADLKGNQLRYAYVDGEMVNLALIENGYAMVSDFPLSFKHQASFLISEESARANLQGVWRDTGQSTSRNTTKQQGQQDAPTQIPGVFSTLPPPPVNGARRCDFSGTLEPAIKGVVDAQGGRTYYIPQSEAYFTVTVNEAHGDRWFCTETEAAAAGWSRAIR